MSLVTAICVCQTIGFTNSILSLLFGLADVSEAFNSLHQLPHADVPRKKSILNSMC